MAGLCLVAAAIFAGFRYRLARVHAAMNLRFEERLGERTRIARELHPIIRDELYRISHEALRNAFRHAAARHIEAEITWGGLDRLIAVNVRAVFVGIQAAVKKMSDGGRIITIGSSAANRIAFPGISAYSMTKAAIQWLVRGLAVDLAPRAITVNNVQPGPIATDINPAHGPEADSLQKSILLGRYGTDEEVASLVAYLSTSDAAFITGANITVDGGYGI